jgi:hypothetical protein
LRSHRGFPYQNSVDKDGKPCDIKVIFPYQNSVDKDGKACDIKVIGKVRKRRQQNPMFGHLRDEISENKENKYTGASRGHETQSSTKFGDQNELSSSQNQNLHETNLKSYWKASFFNTIQHHLYTY